MTDGNRRALVTVATFDAPVVADIARAFLEDHGIRAFVQDAHTVSLLQSSWLTGGVRLQVPAGDEARARELIAALEEGAGHAPESEASSDDPEGWAEAAPGNPIAPLGLALGVSGLVAGLVGAAELGLVLGAMGALLSAVAVARSRVRGGSGRAVAVAGILAGLAAVGRFFMGGAP